MKRLIAILLTVTLMIPVVAYACQDEDSAIYPNIEPVTEEETESVWVALCAEGRHLFGKLYKTEQLTIYPSKTPSENTIRGIDVSGAIIREKGEMKYLFDGCKLYGLTKVQAKAELYEEFLEPLKDILHRKLGEDAELTLANIIACTLERTETTIYHHVFGKLASTVTIGKVIFNDGRDAANLVMGDWHENGTLDIGFEVYVKYVSSQEQTSEPTPTPTSTSTQANCKKTCKKICPSIVVIQISIGNNNSQNVCIKNNDFSKKYQPCLR